MDIEVSMASSLSSEDCCLLIDETLPGCDEVSEEITRLEHSVVSCHESCSTADNAGLSTAAEHHCEEASPTNISHLLTDNSSYQAVEVVPSCDEVPDEIKQLEHSLVSCQESCSTADNADLSVAAENHCEKASPTNSSQSLVTKLMDTEVSMASIPSSENCCLLIDDSNCLFDEIVPGLDDVPEEITRLEHSVVSCQESCSTADNAGLSVAAEEQCEKALHPTNSHWLDTKLMDTAVSIASSPSSEDCCLLIDNSSYQVVEIVPGRDEIPEEITQLEHSIVSCQESCNTADNAGLSVADEEQCEKASPMSSSYSLKASIVILSMLIVILF